MHHIVAKTQRKFKIPWLVLVEAEVIFETTLFVESFAWLPFVVDAALTFIAELSFVLFDDVPLADVVVELLLIKLPLTLFEHFVFEQLWFEAGVKQLSEIAFINCSSSFRRHPNKPTLGWLDLDITAPLILLL